VTGAAWYSSRPHAAPNKAKPINEAMKPMEKNWLPPGMSRKK